MLLKIESVLDKDKLENIRNMLSNVEFIDGKHSAGKSAQQVKHNLEGALKQNQSDYLDQQVMQALAQHPLFQNGALPHQVSQPVFARYIAGMRYGDHIDDPIMGSAGMRFRCDVAVTLFLSNKDDYEGGELVVNTTYGEQKIKLDAGDAILYPASSVHRVNEVTSGERLVAVCWIQSLIRDPAKREILHDLAATRSVLMKQDSQSQEYKNIDHAYVNLMRMWSEL